MTLSSMTPYGCFTHWWAALPAIPADRDSIDWWAKRADGRYSRYKRLKRVWFDHTRFLRPREVPVRPHEFAAPTHGTHLTCKTWENFVLFSPGDWLPRLFHLAGLTCPISPNDCAWSYEFEAMVAPTTRFKLADIVVHARDQRGEELLLVIEVKRPGDTLKEDVDLPDTQPSSYLDREVFADIPQRFLVYLVDASYVPIVRQRVIPADRRWGVLSWAKLAALQMNLAKEICPMPLASFLENVLHFLYQRSGITGLLPPSDAFCGWSGNGLPGTHQLETLAGVIRAIDGLPNHLRAYLEGTLQHLHCCGGTIPLRLAFPYLVEEPSFRNIHELPPSLRQTTADRRCQLWRLPK